MKNKTFQIPPTETELSSYFNLNSKFSRIPKFCSYVGSTACICLLSTFFVWTKMSALPKPVLRGYIKRKGIRTVIGGLCSSVVTGVLFHYYVTVPRRDGYLNFVATYDAEAHYKDLVKWGYVSIHRVQEEFKED